MKRLRLSEAKEGTQILSKRQSQYLTPDLSDPKVQAPSTPTHFSPSLSLAGLLIYLFICLTILLKCHLYSVKLTHFKCIIQ